MSDKDITNLVDFNGNDDEYLPLTECVCGQRFEPWKFIISIYRDTPKECPNCKRKLYFKMGIRVYECEKEI